MMHLPAWLNHPSGLCCRARHLAELLMRRYCSSRTVCIKQVSEDGFAFTWVWTVRLRWTSAPHDDWHA
jgi:hypothetical protein